MKKIIYYLMSLGVLFITSNSLSQEWELLTYPDIPYSVNGIDMLDDGQTGWAVCSGGIILHTTSGWGSWIEQTDTAKTKFDLYDVDFVDSLHGWVVGGNLPNDTSVILFTRNGGKNWEIQGEGLTTKGINTISAVDTNHAWCGGDDGFILHTDDGENWIINSVPDSNEIYGLHMYDTTHGVAVGQKETIYYTKNGVNWDTASVVPDIQDKNFNAVWMMDQNNVWAAGDGESKNLKSVFIKSTDGGDTWDLWIPEEDIYEKMHAITFTNHTKGIAVGDKGRVFITDNGQNWQSLIRQFPTQSQGVALVGNEAWAVGSCGTINYSKDFGKNWTLIPKITTISLFKITAVSNNHIIAVGQNGVMLETTDGGSKWSSKFIIINGEYSSNLSGIGFATDDIGWVCGNKGFIAKTTNGGGSWLNQTNSELTTQWLKDLAVIDENNVWCVGKEGTILNSTDGGKEWKIDYSNVTSKTLHHVSFFDINRGIIVGYSGTFLYTTDGGATWNLVDSVLTGTPKINCCQILDADHAWAISYYGDILFSRDLGENWRLLNTLEDKRYTSIHFKDNLNGWAVNSMGKIYCTTNSGCEWNIVDQNVSNGKGLKSITESPDGQLWVSGDYATILNCDSLCIDVRFQQSHPQNFNLSQNYPNPFNSSTQIMYHVEKTGYVFIAVYNILGEEVKVLVDEKKDIGRYVISLEANLWSSGVYYLKMAADNFKATKKLVLLK